MLRKLRFSRHLARGLVACAIGLLGVPGSGAETGSNTTSGEASALELEKQRLEIANARAQYAKALQELNPRAGTAAVESVAIEPEILGQAALREIAQYIVSETVCSAPPAGTTSTASGTVKPTKRLVIYDKDAFASIVNYRVATPRLETLKSNYADANARCDAVQRGTPAPSGEIRGFEYRAFVAGPALTALGALALLRSDVKISGVAGSKDEDALVAEIARAVKTVAACTVPISVIYPKLFVGRVPDPSSGISKLLTEVATTHARAVARVAGLKKDDASHQSCREVLTSVNQEFEGVWSDLVRPGKDTATSAIPDVLRGEALDQQLGDGATVLYLKVIAQGGNNRSNSHVFWTTVSHSGGAVVTYMALSPEGYVQHGQTVHSYSKYVRDSEIQLRNFVEKPFGAAPAPAMP
jgi:hypothetical protein